ncbi:MAG: hypothetical protein QMD53_07125, partial [Actinomycetota bacterium]|nr:hypothetical protein [Actinomycetota bacterium]
AGKIIGAPVEKRKEKKRGVKFLNYLNPKCPFFSNCHDQLVSIRKLNFSPPPSTLILTHT